MRTSTANTPDWLHQEIQVLTGDSFHLDQYTCLPISTANAAEGVDILPVGFLATRGTEVTYVDAHTPIGERMLRAWQTTHAPSSLPAEYWYG